MSTRLDLSKLTLMDALDLAAVIELEACRRYKQFAEQFGSRGSDDAGAVFQTMAVNENKHCEQLAERRFELFGEKPPRVGLNDVFDVEAPEFGATRWGMSQLRAYRLALSSERKAFAFYDQALPHLSQPDVKALFEELRDEEAEHVAMLEAIIAKLPPLAAVDLEDEDTYPNQPVRDTMEG